LNVQHLVKMANDIASFFEAEPDEAKAAKGVAEHLKNFWAPRMRRQILEYVDGGGAGLKKIAVRAIETHRRELAGTTGTQPPSIPH